MQRNNNKRTFQQITPKPEAPNDSNVQTKKPAPDINCHSLLEYYKSESLPKRRKIVSDVIDDAQDLVKNAHIVVPYRRDGSGKGVYYDHKTIQDTTEMPTAILAQPEQSLGLFKSYVRNVTRKLRYAVENDKSGAIDAIPPDAKNINDLGLLFIPGVSQQEYGTPEYQLRAAFEDDLIYQARLRGQPILAVCGGFWRLWEQFGGKVVSVSEHNYRGGMPRIIDTTGKVGYNVTIHRIQITTPAFLLRAAMRTKLDDNIHFPVNSVHSYAPDASTCPNGLIISALSLQDDHIAPISAHTKERMKPQSDSVEAAESQYGAPVIGVQWHPEAFSSMNGEEMYPDHQKHILYYMAQAGRTYLARTKLNAEFNAKYAETLRQLNKLNLYGFNNHVITRKFKSGIGFRLFKLNESEELRHRDEAYREISIKENYLYEKGYKQTIR